MSAIAEEDLDCRLALPSFGDFDCESEVLQGAYIDSFRSFQLRFPRSADAPRTLTALSAWCTGLDADLIDWLAAFTIDQLQRSVGRELAAAPAASIFRSSTLRRSELR